MTDQTMGPAAAGPDGGVPPAANLVDSGYAWFRLMVCLMLATLGGSGIWMVSIVLKQVQADFGVDRADISLAYTAGMVGFAVGGIVMGRFVDRLGVFWPVVFSACCLGAGFVAAAYTTDIWQYAIVHGLLIGIGSSATFAPLIADISRWFARRRGLAIAICASGNYLAGAVWPLAVQFLLTMGDWRQAYIAIGLVCLGGMLALAPVLRRTAPSEAEQEQAAVASGRSIERLNAGMPVGVLQVLLVLAGLSCCVAMSMPQVHIVAYCMELGFDFDRGAEMLSLMLICGVVSRLVFGWIGDRIGGVRTVLLGSVLQCLALGLYLPFDGLMSLYVVSAVFGLSQGGIVPSYAIVVREYFPVREAGTRVGLVVMATILGMALGGWLSGFIFDVTGDYQAAFVHGIAWNMLNISIMLFLLVRSSGGGAASSSGVADSSWAEMFDGKIRPLIDPPLAAISGWFVARGISADQVTVAGFAMGLCAAVSVVFGQFWLALAFVVANRLADGLDGAIARATQPTERGGFLDITLDFLFYGAMPLAFAAYDPVQNAFPAAVLIASFLANGTAFLAYAIIAAKKGISTTAQGVKTFYFAAGLAEGTETVVVFCLMCLWPGGFVWLAYAFAALCFVSAAGRIMLGWRAFE